MNITKEIAATIAGENSHGIIILNFKPGVGIEVTTAAIGGMRTETLRVLGEAAAKAASEALKCMDGCQCPQCTAGRALSNNTEIARA